MKGRYTVLVLLSAFAMLAAAIVAAGCLLYHSQQDSCRTEAEHKLAAVADLKVAELSMWCQERLADASVLYNNSAFSALVRRCIERPQDSLLQEELRTWIGHFQESEHYNRIALLDIACNQWMSAPDATGTPSNLTRQHAQEALRSGQMTCADFYRDECTEKVYLRLFVPILDGLSSGRPLGVLMLRIDPEIYLYPFIQRWTTPSETSETLLIRREGNEAVFLNELKFRKNAALTLRMSLDRADLPEVKAAQGQEGIVEGLDYRGVPVLAAVHSVPNSPWFLEAKIDLAEVYAPMRKWLWLTFLFVGVLLFGLAAAVGLLWRHQHLRLYRQKRETHRSYNAVLDASADGILLVDVETKMFKCVNPALCRLLGYTEQELKTIHVADIHPQGDLQNVLAEFESLASGSKSVVQDIPCLRKNGTIVYVDINTTGVMIDGRKCLVGVFHDITERKRVQEAFRQSEQLYRSLVDNIAAGITLIDASHTIIALNPALSQMFGKNAAEFVGKKCYREFEKREAVCDHCPGIKAMATGEPAEAETKGVRDDGSSFSVRLRAFPLFGRDGTTTGFIELVEDITVQKLAEEVVHRRSAEIQREYANLQAVFDAAPVGFLLVNDQMEVIRVNHVVAKMVAKDVAQMLGCRPGDRLCCIHAGMAPGGCGTGQACPTCPIRLSMTRVLQAGETVRGVEVRQTSQVNGEANTVWILVDTSPITLNGTPHALLAITDITERKRAEETLQESEERFRTIFEESPLGVAMIDSLTGQIYEVNSRFAAIAGRTTAEMVSIDWMSITHPFDVQKDLDNMALLNAGTIPGYDMEKRYRRPDGSYVWINMTIAPMTVKDKSHPRHLCMIEDITKRKKVEEALLHSRAELQQSAAALESSNHALTEFNYLAESATRAKSEFLANMSHEIRTPLTAILGFAEVLLGEPGIDDAPPERIEAIRTIERNGEHLLRLINDILDLSKVESGKMQIEATRYSPRELLAEVVSLIRVRAEAKHLQLETDLAGPLPETVLTDPLRLRQVLVNLVGNAIKFTDHGEIRITVRLAQDNGRPCLRFDVTDTGIGMNEEQIGRLFQAFGQVDTSAARKFGGSGLGLAISKRLTEAMGGRIEVRSVPGQGSTFSVMIDPGPLDGIRMIQNAHDALLSRPPAATAATSDKIELQGRILLAEDGPDNQRLISFLLKKAGAEVKTVENGQLAYDEALAARVSGKPFDVILMDMQMPVVDGYSATGQLRAQGYVGPIIAITAHAMAGDRQKCLDAGCDDYATKPIDRSKLLATVAHWMARGRTNDDSPLSPCAVRNE